MVKLAPFSLGTLHSFSPSGHDHINAFGSELKEEGGGRNGRLGMLFSLPVATGALNHADQIHRDSGYSETKDNCEANVRKQKKQTPLCKT